MSNFYIWAVMFQETDTSNFHMIQIFRWQIFSWTCNQFYVQIYIQIYTQIYQQICRTIYMQDLQDLQEIYKQICRQYNIGESRQSINSSSRIQFHIWFIYSQENAMAHLAGIDKGPVLDWTDDNGLLEWFRKWKKKVEILFWGPLSTANECSKMQLHHLLVRWDRHGVSGQVGNWR